jgi:hypothetical protein
MIMTQEQAFLKAQEQLQSLIAFVQQSSQQQLRLDQVERGLFSRLLQLGFSLLTAYVAAAGDGNVGDTATDRSNQTWKRLPEPHARPYRSIFGPLSIARSVYGTREGQKIQFVPLDATLGLPEGEFSYVLEEWSQRLCVQGSFAEAVQSLDDLLGLRPSVRSLEHMNQTLAEEAGNFAVHRAAPPPADEGELLVCTADHKGVILRQPAPAAESAPRSEEPRQAPKQPDQQEKRGKKKMACVGAVYTIDRHVRTPQQILDELQRQERDRERPKPCHKHVWAEMTRVVEDQVCVGRITLFDLMAQARAQRNPQGKKVTVCLYDGEKALWGCWEEFLPDSVGILDLFHVSQRLWCAAHCFHPEKSKAAAVFVEERLRQLLEGKVGTVIGGLRQMATKHQLKGQKRKKVLEAAQYFENNREHMKYDEYLAAGYPIGSGVVEGACRHLIKDRLEQTGMRWTVEGAQAMLYLRATYLNEDWTEFLNYRIEREQRRLYGRQAEEPHNEMAV